MSMANLVTQSAPLWFLDGDIVVHARLPGSKQRRCYRIHRQILSLHAPVLLEHMDDVIEADEERWFVDSAPCVFVPESAAVLEWLFQALYHPSSLLRWKYKSTSFKGILPLYKLALKYEINYVTDTLSAQLAQDWPKTLWEWDAFECDDQTYLKRKLGTYSDCMYPEPVAAIEFARVASIESILPAAFYQLARISVRDDYDENDGGNSGSRTARWSDLTQEDHLCLAAGKEQLAHLLFVLQDRLERVIPRQEKKCLDAWRLMPPCESGDILADMKEICKPSRLPGAFMCEDCRRRVNEKAREDRFTVWDMLPKLFRLPMASPWSLRQALASTELCFLD